MIVQLHYLMFSSSTLIDSEALGDWKRAELRALPLGWPAEAVGVTGSLFPGLSPGQGAYSARGTQTLRGQSSPPDALALFHLGDEGGRREGGERGFKTTPPPSQTAHRRLGLGRLECIIHTSDTKHTPIFSFDTDTHCNTLRCLPLGSF